MDAGRIKLDALPESKLNIDVHLLYDCIWQIKTPLSLSDVFVFLRVTSISLMDGKSCISVCHAYK